MPEITRAAVEQRAHKIWIAKGRREGHAIEDWVQAETELRAEAARSARPPAPPTGGNLASATLAKVGGAPTVGGTSPARPSTSTSSGPAVDGGGKPAAKPSKNGRGKRR